MNGWEILKYIGDFLDDLWDNVMDWYDDIEN